MSPVSLVSLVCLAGVHDSLEDTTGEGAPHQYPMSAPHQYHTNRTLAHPLNQLNTHAQFHTQLRTAPASPQLSRELPPKRTHSFNSLLFLLASHHYRTPTCSHSASITLHTHPPPTTHPPTHDGSSLWMTRAAPPLFVSLNCFICLALSYASLNCDTCRTSSRCGTSPRPGCLRMATRSLRVTSGSVRSRCYRLTGDCTLGHAGAGLEGY